MRAILVLVGLAALVVVGLLASGMMTMNVSPGSVPSVAFEGGKAPSVKADMATVEFGVENKTIEVPTVGTKQQTVAVPTVRLNRPANPETLANGQAAQ
ncbi:MAG: hypothetical protein B7Y45_04155 [Sphingomonas sp. 28-66-16]|nr:MAG: hypothetical protein B7Y45_04155 [Sphingomonas sp. 28-66-16]